MDKITDINKEHAQKAQVVVRQSLSSIMTGQPDKFQPIMALEVFSKLMNSILVNVLSDKIHASDKALYGYCCFHRWMIHFIEEYPSLLDYVNESVENFIKNENCRTKSVIPSLGEFLTLLSLSKFTWSDVAPAYISENLDRNVLWILRKYPFLRDLDYPHSDRLRLSFDTVKLGSSFTPFLHFTMNIN